MTREEFISKILYPETPHSHTATCILPIKESTDCDTSIVTILNLDISKISQEGQLVIDVLENQVEFPYRSHYQQMKWYLLALVNIQDIFSGTIYDDFTPKVFGVKNYFYYEGLQLLREYFYTGFNNFLKASDHLPRTILEFNIRQCFYHWKCEETSSYKPLTEYLEKGICPSNHTMLNQYLPADNFCKPIKVKIQKLIKQLSNSSSHAFDPTQSTRSVEAMNFQYTMESLLFWLNLNMVLSGILWSYYITFPMLLKPINIVKKFGYNMPLGLYISDYHFFAFRNTIEPESLDAFLNYSNEQQIVKDLVDYYNSREDLTDQEIVDSWKGEEAPFPKNDYLGLSLVFAKMRVTREMFEKKYNESVIPDDIPGFDPKEFFTNLSSYSHWKDNYSRY